ncbi:12490_t:CDS:2 [Entrophospora sp. SA101]|nr:12490_t:CDS:2 [Entrophospora sp. SA101]
MKPGEFQQKNFTAWQTEYNQAATTQRLNWKKEEGQALIIENNAPSPKTSLRFKIYHRRQRAIAKWVGQFIKSENILHRHHQITITTNNAVLISNAIPAANTITIIVIISNTIITITAIAASQKIVAFGNVMFNVCMKGKRAGVCRIFFKELCRLEHLGRHVALKISTRI